MYYFCNMIEREHQECASGAEANYFKKTAALTSEIFGRYDGLIYPGITECTAHQRHPLSVETYHRPAGMPKKYR